MLTSYDAASSTSFRATGANSTISLPKLASLTAADHFSATSTFTAESGGRIELNALTSVTAGVNAGIVRFVATGTGSEIHLHALESSTANLDVSLQVSALDGGVLNLPALPSVTSASVQFFARSGSVLRLPALTSMTGQYGQLVLNNATIEAPNLTTFTRGSFNVYSSAASYPITNLDGSSIWLSSGGELTLPGVTAFNDLGASISWSASGPSQLELPNLTTITGSQGVSITASVSVPPAWIKLPLLTTLPPAAKLHADGGVIEIPSVVALSGSAMQLTQGRHGLIVAPQLARFESGTLTLSDATADFPSLAHIDGLAITVNQAGQATLPKVTGYHTGVYRLWQADGTGSLLALPNLTTIAAPAGMWFNVTNAGHLEFAALQSMSGSQFNVSAAGTGTRIDLPQLATLISNQTTTVSQSANGVVAFPCLDNVVHVNLWANNPDATFTLLPNQTFYAGNFTGGTLLNQGTVSVLSGVSSISGSLELAGSAALWVASGATLEVTGDLRGNTTNIDHVQPLGTLLLDRNGASASNPQHLEAMSADRGDVAEGFQNNAAYGKLSIANNGYVQVVDQAQNSTPAGAEAVYAAQLILGSGATLDLNGQTMYVHAEQRGSGAQVINGSVTVLHPGGPLVLGWPTSATLSLAGQVDEWTFYGRSGQVVTVRLNPAGLSPPLGWGQVTLLDPNRNVLASAAGTSNGQLLTLSSITLPSDGTYTLAVRAESNHAYSTGNYVLTAYPVITTVRPLTVDQQYADVISAPYAVDQWTFSGTSGQQVALDVLGAAANGIEYSLTGPGNVIVFPGRQSDSGLVNLPASGSYVLTVQSPGGNTGGYAFELKQTSVMPLGLGDTYNGTFAGPGDAQLFTVNMPVNELLQVKLADTTAADVNELYARLGVPPTRGEYDYRATATGSANQQLLIPAAAPGTWYILVYGNSVSSGSSYTLEVSTTPLALTDVVPSKWAAGSTASLVLRGSGFDRSTAVQLVSADNTVYTAASVSLDTFAQVSAAINLTGVPQGTYAVRAVRGDGASAQLPGAFTVTSPGQAHLETKLILPGQVGRHIAATFFIEYANTGNVAMPAPLLFLDAVQPESGEPVLPLFTLDPTLQTAGFWTSALPEGYAHTIQILGSGKVPGVLEPGESVTVPVYYGGMQRPWNWGNQYTFELLVFTTADTQAVDWSSLKDDLRPSGFSAEAWAAVYGNLTAQLGETIGSYVQLLDHQAAYLGHLGENVTDVSRLWALSVAQANNGLLPLFQYSVATDIGLPTPGQLALNFSRQERVAIDARYTLGPLGYGWTHNWQYASYVASDGTVTVVMPSGVARVFQPDSRGAARAYFSHRATTAC